MNQWRRDMNAKTAARCDAVGRVIGVLFGMLLIIGLFWCVWTWAGYGVHWFPWLPDSLVFPSYVDLLAAAFCVRIVHNILIKE